VQDHFHHSLFDRLFEWDLIVSKELEMHRRIWILLPNPAECAIDAIYGSPRIETEYREAKRLAGTCAIALGMAIGSSMPVAYSFVVPIAKAVPLSGHYVAEE
jgi:hypothetical protein